MPLQLMFEQIYYIIGFKLTHDPGLSIIVLSLTVNFLVLPLYNRADAVQEAERKIDAKLRRGVDHIKKTFKGDEQLMMLQTYYRQNNYSPFDVIKGSISLFLEIPFFVAAYQFLSHLSILQGAVLGPIKDLGMPDGLLHIAGMTVNVLPLIMTAVNLLATLLFVDGLATRTKIQLYGLAFFFLFFLYQSPSGLVFYWTLNNLFNLGKTIVYKYRKSQEILSKPAYAEPEGKLFFAGAAFLAILSGLLIPSSVISASPQEFIVLGYMDNPLWYLLASFTLAVGSFLIWLGVFYWLGEAKTRLKFEFFVWAFSVAAIVTYLIWGKNTSLLSANLVLANGLQLAHKAKIINIVLILGLCAGLRYFWLRYRKFAFEILTLGCVALLGMSGLNVFTISKSIANVLEKKNVITETGVAQDKNKLVLSKHGKNVIVLMIDGAIGAQVPYILKERPALKEKLAGFTYYNNVISYGSHTLFGSPGIFGGYEYTPLEMNKRTDMTLKDKHNEAMLLLPVMFDKLGYKATVSDLPLVNYQWIPDYTPFKAYPGIRIESYGKLDKVHQDEGDVLNGIADNKRNFYCYGFMKVLPLVLQNVFYSSGTYTGFSRTKDQSIRELVYASGMPKSTRKEYLALEGLPAKTKIVEKGDTFLSFTNDITHDNGLLQLPNYTLSEKVDNSKLADYDGENFIINGKRLVMKTQEQVTKYHLNMAAFLKLGEWFDYLRSQGVYDNTRIILVSDHGCATEQLEDLMFGKELNLKSGKGLNKGDGTAYFALLMVKDFQSKDFTVSDEFMTNADVPELALKDIIANPVNPFTGKAISGTSKRNPEQFIIESDEYELRYNQGNSYQKARWFAVKNNIWDKKGWRLAGEDTLLPQ